MDSELEQSQKQMVEDIANLQESIKTNEAQLDTMERDMPQQPSASMTSVLKRAILFGIIGGVLGGVIICLWVLLSYLADNRLDGAYQVGKLYNIELFAVVSSEEKKRRPLFHKLIDCLEQNASRRQFAGQESAVDYADVSVRSLERQGQGPLTVAAVSSCKDEQVQKLLDSFEQKSGDGVRYVACPAVLSDPASMEKATGADAVLLVERSGVSLIPHINAEIIRLEKAGREIVGMVLAE